MTSDVAERFLRDPIEDRALVDPERRVRGVRRQLTEHSRSFREFLHEGVQGGNQPQVVERRGAQVAGELMDIVHRFLHEPLRLGYFLRELSGAAGGLVGQRAQMHADADQGLGDFIVQLAADPLAFRFLRVKDLMGEMPRPLQQPGLLLPAPA